MKIEADLADGQNFLRAGEPFDGGREVRREKAGLMGMQAGRGQDGRLAGGEVQGNIEAPPAGDIDGAEDRADAGLPGPLEDVRTVGVELLHVEVSVGVNEIRRVVHSGIKTRVT